MTAVRLGAWARQAARAPWRPIRSLVSLPAALTEVVGGLAGELPPAVRLGPQRFRRRAWASGGRGLIEMRRANDGDGVGPAAQAVSEALHRVQGVRWAQVNAVTGHVLVLFDQRAVRLDTLVETVTGVEEARGQADTGWSRAEPPHPGDPAAVSGAALALMADAAGLAAAAATRLLLVPPVPTAARALVGIVEAQPRIRRLVERAVGPAGADALVGIGSGILNGLTGGVGPVAVTGLSHALLLGEVRARRAAWQRFEEQLRAAPGPDPVHPPVKAGRPDPFPAGPVERLADTVAGVSLLVAGVVLVLTGGVSRAANLLLIGVPPAARLGREAFAATLARHIACHGVLVMDPRALRRLDRITTVLVDQALLDPDDRVDPRPRAVGDRAAALADVVARLSDAGLTVGSAGGRAPARGSAAGPGEPLSAVEIRRLQADGEAVLVVATSDNDILAAADVALAVHQADRPVGWAGDLICAADLGPALTVLQAVPAARRLSRRSAALAAAGSALGGLLTALAPRPLAGDLTLQPVYLAALLTQLDGVRAARALATRAGRTARSGSMTEARASIAGAIGRPAPAVAAKSAGMPAGGQEPDVCKL